MTQLLIKPLLALCLILCAGSALLFAKKSAASYGCFALAWILNLTVFALNCVHAQAPAFGNMFHVMVFLPLALPVFYLYGRRVGAADTLPTFAWVAALVFLGTLFMDTQADWRQMPALQSPWFVPHVFTYLVAYALLAVAAALSVRRMKQADMFAGFGFAFLTLGLVSGALWADEVWGYFWSWDIKEVWALVTWVIYLAYFHLKEKTRLSATGRVVLALGFLALLITFFAVNLLPKISSLHSYAS